jgi:hypothetical protein
MEKKIGDTKSESTGALIVSKYPVKFPVTKFGDMNLTMDEKTEIGKDSIWYMKHIEGSEELSKEEIMYLVKRVNDLESAFIKLREVISLYENG